MKPDPADQRLILQACLLAATGVEIAGWSPEAIRTAGSRRPGWIVDGIGRVWASGRALSAQSEIPILLLTVAISACADNPVWALRESGIRHGVVTLGVGPRERYQRLKIGLLVQIDGQTRGVSNGRQATGKQANTTV